MVLGMLKYESDSVVVGNGVPGRVLNVVIVAVG